MELVTDWYAGFTCTWGTVRIVLACLEVLYILPGREDLQAQLHHCQYSSGAEIMVSAAVVAKFPIWSMLQKAARTESSPRTSGNVPGN